MIIHINGLKPFLLQHGTARTSCDFAYSRMLKAMCERNTRWYMPSLLSDQCLPVCHVLVGYVWVCVSVCICERERVEGGGVERGREGGREV